MNIFGRWSVTSFINFIVQLAWAGVVVLLGLQVIFIALQFWGLSFSPIGLPINLEETMLPRNLSLNGTESIVTFIEPLRTSYHPALLTDGFQWDFIAIRVTQIAGLGIILYGLSQLKGILRNLVREKPFAADNERRLKTIAILVMLATPFLYGYQWLSFWFFTSHINTPQNIQAVAPTFDIIYIILGLVILILAEIFRQATQIHEEQKLTI
jgi:hypothetical protein